MTEERKAAGRTALKILARGTGMEYYVDPKGAFLIELSESEFSNVEKKIKEIPILKVTGIERRPAPTYFTEYSLQRRKYGHDAVSIYGMIVDDEE